MAQVSRVIGTTKVTGNYGRVAQVSRVIGTTKVTGNHSRVARVSRVMGNSAEGWERSVA